MPLVGSELTYDHVPVSINTTHPHPHPSQDPIRNSLVTELERIKTGGLLGVCLDTYESNPSQPVFDYSSLNWKVGSKSLPIRVVLATPESLVTFENLQPSIVN